MNNNIGNMNSANPLGFNPQGHKAPASADCNEKQELQEETSCDKDILRHVPGDNYGRAMINKTTNHPDIEMSTVEDDLLTYELLRDFTQNLINGYVEKGIDKQKACKMAAITLDVLLNLKQIQ